jgi:hypothetical protein
LPHPLLRCAQCTLCPLVHVLFSSLFIIQGFCFVFFGDGGQTVQGAMLVYPRGSCGNTACHLFAHLLVCISQAGLEPPSGGTGALLFSQCNMVWRCWRFRLSEFCFFLVLFLFCQVWLQHLNKIFDLRSSHCPPSSHHLESSLRSFLIQYEF